MTNIVQARSVSFSVVWNTGCPQDFAKPLVNGIGTEYRPVRSREKEIILLQPTGRIISETAQQFQQ